MLTFFDDTAIQPQTFDPTAGSVGWFDDEMSAAAAGVAFDPAFMAAIHRPQPVIVYALPKVVASGMTPPDRMPD